MNKELIEFIRKAKQQTYSSLNSKPNETQDGGKTYTIKEKGYTYTDTYFGNLVDSGQEKVSFNKKVIWVMAYRGGIIEKFENMHNEAFNFLKRCISKMPKNFPIRGPRIIKSGNWRYTNNWKGNIEGFIGEESIYFNNKKICFRNYLGGMIKNKK